MTQIFLRVGFVLGIVIGIIAVFYASWFWRLLLVPMIVILLWDGVRSLWRKS